MNQAARCPNCRTVFRIQPQQLQASGGWARCGQCGEVFNALQALVAVPSLAPAPDNTAAASAPARSAAPGAQASPRPGAGGTGAPLDADPPPVSSLYRRAEPGMSPTPPGTTTPTPISQPAEKYRPRTDTVPPSGMVDVPAPTPAPAADVFPTATVAADSPPMQPSLPSPVQDATAVPPAPASFLQAPPPPLQETSDVQRTWWAAGATLLVLAALLQGMLIARPALSARFPASRPLLQPLCVLTRCNAEAAPRHLAALTVESSALSRLSGNDQHYRLSLVLRNRDTQALRWPAIELRLTDAQGVMLVRKVLRAREFGADVVAIPAGREMPLQAVLDMGEQPVAGYSVELFYP
jgi:predicted Zn finger-like uncharacterized protein